MLDEHDRKVYVVYEFKTEDEKRKYESIPLVGKQFFVNGILNDPKIPAHQFAFDMKAYLKSKNAIGILEISEWNYLKTVSTFSQKIHEHRFYLKKHIEETFPETLAGEAQALLIGVQENVDEEMSRAYQKLGITHLFAISGLHIAILSFIIFQGLIRLGVRRELATLLLIVVLPIYAVLAGGAPSVWRAVTVVELVLISKWKFKMSIDDALAISFILFVLIDPSSIYQIGFQLSYLATAGLIYSQNLFMRIQSWWIQSFLITFVCQLIVYPLLIFHFYEISLSSFIVNIVFVPLFSFIITPINIVLLMVSLVPGPVSQILFYIYEPLRILLEDFIYWLQSFPSQTWIAGKPLFILLLLSYVSVFLTFYFLDTRAKLAKILMVLFIPVMLIEVSSWWSQDLKVSFLNVGQGDCIVIELPYQKEVYVIDTGGLLRFKEEDWKKSDSPYEIGREVVVPYLKGKGINKIDKLILTHADSDHVEGAEEILEDIDVEEIHISPNSYEKEVMIDLLKVAKSLGIPIKEQIANTSWNAGSFTFQYLWPNDTQYEDNNDSLVLYVTNGNFKALFTGDLEASGEEKIINTYPNLIDIDLLKAGHHGSKTSSSEVFLKRLKPTLAVFSAGENNRYGHPHEEVIKRFESLGVKTLTTFKVGTIEVRVNNKLMIISTSNRLF